MSAISPATIYPGSVIQVFPYPSGEDVVTAGVFAAKAVDTLSRANGIATCITVDKHQLQTPVNILIAGANEAVFNGWFLVEAEPIDDYTFTFAIENGEQTATGTITMQQGISTTALEVEGHYQTSTLVEAGDQPIVVSGTLLGNVAVVEQLGGSALVLNLATGKWELWQGIPCGGAAIITEGAEATVYIADTFANEASIWKAFYGTKDGDMRIPWRWRDRDRREPAGRYKSINRTDVVVVKGEPDNNILRISLRANNQQKDLLSVERAVPSGQHEDVARWRPVPLPARAESVQLSVFGESEDGLEISGLYLDIIERGPIT
jgi:hypothetical protein